MPANLLISDPSSEWLKAGVPIVLQYDLLTSHWIVPGLSTDESTAKQAGATHLLRTSIESRQGGIHFESTLVDLATQKVVRVESADASSPSILLPAINALAKKLDPDAGVFSTNVTAAWQAYTAAESTSNAQERGQAVNQAITKDKNFGFAWVTLMEMIPANRDTDLKNLLDEAKSHRAFFTPYDQVKFDLALARLQSTTPADQVKGAQAVLKLAPNDMSALATLGNYEIVQGSNAAGEAALRQAAALNPLNPNLHFELARGLMEVRKFKEAEGLLAGLDKNHPDSPELATCVLLEGDKTRAAGIMDRAMAGVDNPDMKNVLHGAWEVMSGDRQKGIDTLLTSKYQASNIQVLAFSQAAIWQMMGGDYAGVNKTFAGLPKPDPKQPVSPLPFLVSLLADKTTPPAEWKKKIDTLPIPNNVKAPLFAYGFFLHGNYQEAADAWQKQLDSTHGEDLHARAMLASSLDHLGKKAESQKIAVLPFSPDFTDLYAAISFTEMRRMLSLQSPQ